MSLAIKLSTGALFVAVLSFPGPLAQAADVAPRSAAHPNVAELARSGAQSRDLAFRLTTPAELKQLLGNPEKEGTEAPPDKQLVLEYPGVRALFGQLGENAPTTLLELTVEGQPVEIGRSGLLTLRRIDDLGKLGTFWGLVGVSAANLDLTGQKPLLEQLPFDTRTQWPIHDKMPSGFDPAKLIEEGKNPGLGVRELHRQGLDGRGIVIAIIDQPLLRGHQEYKDRLLAYTEIDVAGVPPQMHGSPVTSIAVGKTCGTAPGATVHYYAVPMWKWWNEHCKPYATTLEQIIAQNKALPADKRVRVVSLSLGAMSEWPDRELWDAATLHAANEGILVLTCDPAYNRLAILKRRTGAEPDAPTNYVSQFAFARSETLGVPAGNRTTASHSDPEDYIFWRAGGMSWTVPYLAGVSALGFQVDPNLKPQSVFVLWLKTATKTPAGLVVNPAAFIEAVRSEKTARQAEG